MMDHHRRKHSMTVIKGEQLLLLCKHTLPLSRMLQVIL
jgi:hypothetical protein